MPILSIVGIILLGVTVITGIVVTCLYKFANLLIRKINWKIFKWVDIGLIIASGVLIFLGYLLNI